MLPTTLSNASDMCLTSELTISSGTLCTIDTVAVDSGSCCFPFLLCNLRPWEGVGTGQWHTEGMLSSE